MEDDQMIAFLWFTPYWWYLDHLTTATLNDRQADVIYLLFSYGLPVQSTVQDETIEKV